MKGSDDALPLLPLLLQLLQLRCAHFYEAFDLHLLRLPLLLLALHLPPHPLSLQLTVLEPLDEAPMESGLHLLLLTQGGQLCRLLQHQRVLSS